MAGRSTLLPRGSVKWAFIVRQNTEAPLAKKKRASIPVRQRGDSERMTAAIDWIESARLPLIRKTMAQLKIGPLNFYPDKGTFHFEGAPAGREKGLRAFKIAVHAWQEEERRDFL